MWCLIDLNSSNIRHNIPKEWARNLQHYTIIGIGMVELNLPGGSTLVLHFLTFQRNEPEISNMYLSSQDHWSQSNNWTKMTFVSAPQQESGHSTRGTTDCQRTKGALIVPTICHSREGGLFLVDIPVSSLWHCRFFHFSKLGIAHLSRSGYIPKLSFSVLLPSSNTGFQYSLLWYLIQGLVVKRWETCTGNTQ